jgi:integrase
MKSGREHRVPLAAPAVAILDDLPRFSSGFVFEGNPGKPLSENGMLDVLKRMGRSDITVHGFRSTFRDWCAEQTAYPREIAEAALAHVNRDRVEAAYLRSDLLRRRYRLMQKWAIYATTPSDKIVVKLPLPSSA